MSNNDKTSMASRINLCTVSKQGSLRKGTKNISILNANSELIVDSSDVNNSLNANQKLIVDSSDVNNSLNANQKQENKNIMTVMNKINRNINSKRNKLAKIFYTQLDKIFKLYLSDRERYHNELQELVDFYYNNKVIHDDLIIVVKYELKQMNEWYEIKEKYDIDLRELNDELKETILFINNYIFNIDFDDNFMLHSKLHDISMMISFRCHFDSRVLNYIIKNNNRNPNLDLQKIVLNENEVIELNNNEIKVYKAFSDFIYNNIFINLIPIIQKSIDEQNVVWIDIDKGPYYYQYILKDLCLDEGEIGRRLLIPLFLKEEHNHLLQHCKLCFDLKDTLRNKHAKSKCLYERWTCFTTYTKLDDNHFYGKCQFCKTDNSKLIYICNKSHKLCYDCSFKVKHNC